MEILNDTKKSPIQDLYEQLWPLAHRDFINRLFVLNDKHPRFSCAKNQEQRDRDCLSVLIGKMGFLVRA